MPVLFLWVFWMQKIPALFTLLVFSWRPVLGFSRQRQEGRWKYTFSPSYTRPSDGLNGCSIGSCVLRPAAIFRFAIFLSHPSLIAKNTERYGEATVVLDNTQKARNNHLGKTKAVRHQNPALSNFQHQDCLDTALVNSAKACRCTSEVRSVVMQTFFA